VFAFSQPQQQQQQQQSFLGRPVEDFLFSNADTGSFMVHNTTQLKRVSCSFLFLLLAVRRCAL
jgi:hypothetical protein